MKNTKLRILETALRLFNEQGVSKITVRQMAGEVGISHGNLCYHFKNKDVIIYQLYKNLVEKLKTEIHDVLKKGFDLESFLELNRKNMAHLYQNRFFVLHFSEIMQNNPTIRTHYRSFSARRREEYDFFVRQLIFKEIFRPEKSENEYDKLITRLFILSDFWIASAELFHSECSENQKLNFYENALRDEMKPYLTPKGLEKFNQNSS